MPAKDKIGSESKLDKAKERLTKSKWDQLTSVEKLAKPKDMKENARRLKEAHGY